MKAKFDCFIIYETYSGKDLAEHLKKALARVKINAFVASKDIPLGTDEKAVRYTTLHETENIILILTEGAFASEEVTNEIKACIEYGKRENIMPFKYEAVLSKNASKFLTNVDIGIKQWQVFSTQEELSRKVQASYSNRQVTETRRRTDTEIYSGELNSAKPVVFNPFIKALEFMKAYKWEEAIALLRVALGETKKESSKAELLNLIGNCFSHQGELEQALGHYAESLDLAKAISDKQGIAANLGGIGQIYRIKGEPDKALEYFEEARGLYRETGNKEGEARQLGNAGSVFRIKGELDKALLYHNDAVKLDKETGNKEGEARQLGNIGLIYKTRKEPDTALKYLQNALDIQQRIGDKKGEANQLGNIGLIYEAKGETGEALKYFKECRDISREIKYREGEAAQLNNIGIIYQAKGEIDKALKYFEECRDLFKEIGHREGEAAQLGNIGLIYGIKGDKEKALRYLCKALMLFRRIGVKAQIELTEENIRMIQEQQKSQ